LDPTLWIIVVTITLGAGFVKGAVGFAMPMIMISGFATVLPPDTALAALILPTLVTNVWQGGRDGLRAAWESVRDFRLYLVAIAICIAASAQLVNVLPQGALFLAIGLPIVAFAAMQLARLTFTVPPRHRRAADIGVGAFSGAVGGLSGVWGPPTVAYLTALGTEKRASMRIQGVIYGAASVVLAAAHLKSGVLDATTLPISAALVIPALIGTWAGFRVHDRMDPVRFRRWTQIVLLLAGLNLIRRGLGL
jgi:hypothetical protein